MHHAAVNRLQLVCPPISNQEADKIAEVAEFRELVARSQIYMIAQHEEVFFRDVQTNQESTALYFSLSNSRHKVERLELPLAQFFGGKTGVSFAIGSNDAGAFLQIWRAEKGALAEMVADFTPEALLFALSRRNIALANKVNCEAFGRYRLHYVGISKKGDSLSRLFANAHEKRLKILTNAYPMRQGARTTDELFIFLFDIEEMQMKAFSPDEPDLVSAIASLVSEPPSFDKLRLIADAEKAFIKIMQSEYNEQRYESFPKGSDGLYGLGLNRYLYTIDEDIELETPNAQVRGRHDGEVAIGEGDFVVAGGDFIAVSGDDVLLVKVPVCTGASTSDPDPEEH